MTSRGIGVSVSLWLTMAVLGAVRSAGAASFSYPGNDCVSTKQSELGKYCKSTLSAWATFDAKYVAS